MKCIALDPTLEKILYQLSKMLGYTPTSPKSPTSSIDVTINNVTGSGLQLQWIKGTAFTTTVDGNTYQFIT